MDEFAQKGLIEFGHYPAHIRMVGQGLDASEHFLCQPRPDAGHALLCVPGLHLLKIAECDSAKLMTIRGTTLFQTVPCPGLIERYLIP